MKRISSAYADGLCRVSVCVINKDDAIKILGNNSKNRKIAMSNVEILKKSMNDGRWMFNGDSIVVDHEGYLKSGQHRLTAFINSNLDEITVIFVELIKEDDVLLTLNRGKSLTTSQYLAVKGYKNANSVAAISKAYLSILSAYENRSSIFAEIATRRPDYIIERCSDENANLISMALESNIREKVRSQIAALLIFCANKNEAMRSEIVSTFKMMAEMDTPKNSLAHAIISVATRTSSRSPTCVATSLLKAMSAIKNWFAENREIEKFYECNINEFFDFLNSYKNKQTMR